MQIIHESTVSLVDHMGSDLSPVNAARVSYGAQSEQLNERDIKLLRYLGAHNHTSPFGHTCIQIRVRAPIFVARQLVKHQVGLTWNEISRRYTSTNIDFYLPPEAKWRLKPEKGSKQSSSDETLDAKTELVDESGHLQDFVESHVMHSYWLYENMLRMGIANEQARMILPVNIMTEWIWTGSLLAFHRVYKLRTQPDAQIQTREVALQIGKICQELFPVSWEVLNG